MLQTQRWNQTVMPHGGPHTVGLAIFCTLLLSASAAVGTEPDPLEEQLRLQEQLLERVAGKTSPGGTPPKPYAEADTPQDRTAPPTPANRDYPPAIFDVTKVVIPPGQWGNRDRLILSQHTLDADRDGKPELQRWIDPESKLLIRQIEDRNYDGVQDTWSQFEWGVVTSRSIDSNDDGNTDVFEKYADGLMTSREVDRDDDGVRDAFYRYEGDSLVGEQHDANNDGGVDLAIVYEKRRRVRSEEDVDHDKQVDTWTFFSKGTGPEVAIRIERDTQGRGKPDTFEFFADDGGTAVIERREQDVNGNGDIDIISIYENGKLIRREIYELSLAGEG